MSGSCVKLFYRIAEHLVKVNTKSLKNISQIDELVDIVFEERFSLLSNVLRQKDCARVLSENILNLDNHSEIQINLKPADKDIWIFGYGSLVWKPDFEYIVKKCGYICGYERRFYQNSIDHRGTKDRPGRVVTLVPSKDPNFRVYGVAYRIADIQKDNIIKQLDFREKNGYKRCTLEFVPCLSGSNPLIEDSKFTVTMYIATEDNESYAGHLNNDDYIANQIYYAEGPSGINREYVYNLAKAMKKYFPGVIDDHLFTIESKLKEKEKFDDKMALTIKNEMKKIFLDGMKCQEIGLEDQIASNIVVAIQKLSEKYSFVNNIN